MTIEKRVSDIEILLFGDPKVPDDTGLKGVVIRMQKDNADIKADIRKILWVVITVGAGLLVERLLGLFF